MVMLINKLLAVRGSQQHLLGKEAQGPLIPACRSGSAPRPIEDVLARRLAPDDLS